MPERTEKEQWLVVRSVDQVYNYSNEMPFIEIYDHDIFYLCLL